MSKFKPLVIGDLVVKKPVIQGGMGVGISLHSFPRRRSVFGSRILPRIL